MIEFLSYRNHFPRAVWPKTPPPLTTEQLKAREAYMLLWHQELPKKYGIVEKFNHGYITQLPVPKNCQTLEIGAGLGSHCQYEDLTIQKYHCLEYREEFCEEIRKILPHDQVTCGDIQSKQPWEANTFDRIIAIHVLEHLPNLPLALVEIQRLLKDTGFLDIVIPCEGGIAHTFARKISAERLFNKNFKMDFTPIHLNEHVNSYGEIDELLKKDFKVAHSSFFPLKVRLPNINICVGMRLQKRAKI